VTKLLREHFGDFVETDFTAEMEDDLDEISRGERESVAFLREFYYGDKKHRGLLPARRSRAPRRPTTRCSIWARSDERRAVRIRPSAASARSCRWAKAVRAVRRRCRTKWRRQISRVDKALEQVRAKAEGPAHRRRRIRRPGLNVYVMNGRYGAYVQLGEDARRARRRRSRSARRCKPG
jgi:hypothetical protein